MKLTEIFMGESAPPPPLGNSFPGDSLPGPSGAVCKDAKTPCLGQVVDRFCEFTVKKRATGRHFDLNTAKTKRIDVDDLDKSPESGEAKSVDESWQSLPMWTRLDLGSRYECGRSSISRVTISADESTRTGTADTSKCTPSHSYLQGHRGRRR